MLWLDRSEAVDDRFFRLVTDLRRSSLRESELVVRRGVACAGGATGRAESSNGDNNDGDDNADDEAGRGVATIDGSFKWPDHAVGSVEDWGWGAFEEGDAAGGSSRLEGSMTQREKGALGGVSSKGSLMLEQSARNRTRSQRVEDGQPRTKKCDARQKYEKGRNQNKERCPSMGFNAVDLPAFFSRLARFLSHHSVCPLCVPIVSGNTDSLLTQVLCPVCNIQVPPS